MGNLSTVLSTEDRCSRLSRLFNMGLLVPCQTRLVAAPRDAHPGDTRPVRHAYLYLSHQHLQGVGDAPVSCRTQ